MNAKKIGMKAFALILALVLLIGCVAGGTVAYLMATTTEVKNTFVAGNIGTLKLEETCDDKFIVVPGHNIAKDPTVKLSGNNVDAYVFLEVNAAGWTYAKVGDAHVYYMGDTYEEEGGKRVEAVIADGWLYLEPGVFYRVADADTPVEYKVIKNDVIVVDATITQGNILDFIDDYNAEHEGANLTIDNFRTSLSFTAYAIQKANTAATYFTPAEAWAQFSS